MKKTALPVFIFFLITSAVSSEKKWEVYFTSPAGVKKSRSVNPAEGLIRAIKRSKKSFYGAFYDISYGKIVHELITAHNRGVDVRLVTENDTFSGKAVTEILESGIPVVPDTGSGLMHNKFAVIDGESVFTGSYNTTENCTVKNNNNALLIHSPELAEIYASEFNEMFDSGVFGNKREEGAFSPLTKKYHVRLDDMNINAYFAPEDNIEKILYQKISKAEQSIKFMQFSFTSDKIGELMISRFKSGVKVEGVFEKKGSDSEYSEFIKMKIEGIPVRTDRNRGVMHHKVIIIDGRIIITGSFNVSKNADSRNDENIIIIESPELAEKFNDEFHRIFKEAGK